MIPLLAAMQATTVEPLPEDAATTATQAVTDALPAAGNHGIDLVQLVLHASIPVQLVMLLLLFASVASWLAKCCAKPKPSPSCADRCAL